MMFIHVLNSPKDDDWIDMIFERLTSMTERQLRNQYIKSKSKHDMLSLSIAARQSQ